MSASLLFVTELVVYDKIHKIYINRCILLKMLFRVLKGLTEDYLPAQSLIRPSDSAASPKELLTPIQK